MLPQIALIKIAVTFRLALKKHAFICRLSSSPESALNFHIKLCSNESIWEFFTILISSFVYGRLVLWHQAVLWLWYWAVCELWTLAVLWTWVMLWYLFCIRMGWRGEDVTCVKLLRLTRRQHGVNVPKWSILLQYKTNNIFAQVIDPSLLNGDNHFSD